MIVHVGSTTVNSNLAYLRSELNSYKKAFPSATATKLLKSYKNY